MAILLQLMPNGTDADNLAADFKRGNESGASEGDDQFALLVVHGASGLATRVRRKLEQSKCPVDGVSDAPHDVEVRRRSGEFTLDYEILDPEQVVDSLVREDDAVDGHCPALGLPAASRCRATSSRTSIRCSTSCGEIPLSSRSDRSTASLARARNVSCVRRQATPSRTHDAMKSERDSPSSRTDSASLLNAGSTRTAGRVDVFMSAT